MRLRLADVRWRWLESFGDEVFEGRHLRDRAKKMLERNSALATRSYRAGRRNAAWVAPVPLNSAQGHEEDQAALELKGPTRPDDREGSVRSIRQRAGIGRRGPAHCAKSPGWRSGSTTAVAVPRPASNGHRFSGTHVCSVNAADAVIGLSNDRRRRLLHRSRRSPELQR